VTELWFKIFSPNLAVEQKYFEYEICQSTKFKMAAWRKFALSGFFFLFYSLFELPFGVIKVDGLVKH